MLLACASCLRLYDVGDLEPGQRIRCTCGARTRVPARRPRQKEIANCGNCGAPLDSGAKRCQHCSARVTLAEEGLGQPCPACFARLPRKARFCSACGVALLPEATLQAVTRTECPRCERPLAVTEGKLDPFHQCTGCGGIWLSRRAFTRVLEDAREALATPEERKEVAARRAGLRGAGRRRRRPFPSARCPVCALLMLVQEFAHGSGIEVEACAKHGWWFDDGELERIRRFVAAGGLEPRPARRRRSARRGGRLESPIAARWRAKCDQQNRRDAILLGLLGVWSLDGDD